MTAKNEGITGSPSTRLVALFVDEHTERGVAVDARSKSRFAGEVKRLLDTYGEDVLAEAIPRHVDAGAAIANFGEYARTSALRIAKAERGETPEEEARRLVKEYLNENPYPTGCTTTRGSHGMSAHYDVFGSEPIEEIDWPYGRPSFADMVEAMTRHVIRERLDA